MYEYKGLTMNTVNRPLARVNHPQILSITCDNASNNDTMIEHLATLLDNYPGAANRTRCFAHILNLVAKCIMKQFDAPKKKNSKETDSETDEEGDELAGALDELEEELEDYGKQIEDDWENDMRADMTSEEVKKLEDGVKPVRCVLSKVNSNRTTLVGSCDTKLSSYERPLTLSRIRQPLFCLSGSQSSTEWPLPVSPKGKNHCPNG